MVILLIMEKQAQIWSINRFGCTIDKIRTFKILDEKMRKILKNKSPEELNKTSDIEEIEPLKEWVSIGEA